MTEDVTITLTCIVCGNPWTSVEQQQDRILFKPCGHMRTVWQIQHQEQPE